MTHFVRQAAAAFCLVFAAVAAQAQDYPSRSVRVLVPYGAGTGIDVAARIVAEKLSRSLGQSFVVENRTGAAGTIAGAAVVSAPADGYTLLADASGFTTVPALMKNIPYDPRRDLVGVATIGSSPLVLVTSPGKGYKTVRELVAAGKARPGALTFASAGVGTTTHLSAEKFRVAAGFQALHVPYKSTTDALAEVMAGRIDYLVTTVPSALALVKDGRLVALATGVRRAKALPDVPTMAEAGFPGAGNDTWFALFASAKVPSDVVARLNAETAKAVADPEVRDKLSRAGAEPFVNTPEEFGALLRREFNDTEQLVKAIGAKID
jgi:tripartite-type tricarboxylate transporter receptor subunit TctC